MKRVATYIAVVCVTFCVAFVDFRTCSRLRPQIRAHSCPLAALACASAGAVRAFCRSMCSYSAAVSVCAERTCTESTAGAETDAEVSMPGDPSKARHCRPPTLSPRSKAPKVLLVSGSRLSPRSIALPRPAKRSSCAHSDPSPGEKTSGRSSFRWYHSGASPLTTVSACRTCRLLLQAPQPPGPPP